jgi:hypothetical protein
MRIVHWTVRAANVLYRVERTIRTAAPRLRHSARLLRKRARRAARVLGHEGSLKMSKAAARSAKAARRNVAAGLTRIRSSPPSATADEIETRWPDRDG